MAHKARLLMVMDRSYRAVDWYLFEVGAVKAVKLGVHIRKYPGLQQRIIGHINAWYHMSGVKSHLFRLRKEIVRVPVQYHLTDALYRNQLLRQEFGRIQQIKVKLLFILVRHHLDTKSKFKKIPHDYSISKVTQ